MTQPSISAWFTDFDSCNDEESQIEMTCIVDSAYGIYVPQVFCQRYERTDSVDAEDWEICLSGPDHEFYWESWEEILNNWGDTETDAMGNVYRIFIDQDQDLYQCRQFLRAEYSKRDLAVGID